jgi:hypothetical protein
MNKNESTVEIERLHEMFSCTKDGCLFWRERPISHFMASPKRSAEHICANWNARYAGHEAIACVTPFGHKTGRINDKLFYAHRIIWAIHTGAWPKGEIDHINGIPADNRFENLRDVSHKQNLKNQAMRKNNTSGELGVRFYRPRHAWTASIGVNGKAIHLGYFGTKEKAVEARLMANAQHGFHLNHGRKS